LGRPDASIWDDDNGDIPPKAEELTFGVYGVYRVAISNVDALVKAQRSPSI